jgi:hypothetical protein
MTCRGAILPRQVVARLAIQAPRLQKRDDRSCSPKAYRVEIKGEIAIPFTAHSVLVIFSRAESDPYPSKLESQRLRLQSAGGG